MIWLQLPWMPIYFVGLGFLLVAFRRRITRWLGPSVDEQLRDSQRLIRESHDTAARIQARTDRHGPHFKD